ncbi:polyphosphate kinase 2 [Sabulilitoribacter multivorans]|uniref:ADP/GDP-polyphosphate phosphotransferase n=1 Tax=Flaviramulus multivorans TaxID=1304750 RepID=A0ABS9IJC4_9FLAO|nr:polyphosphate kinase 2 [Flaviramulus multivorans]MCF7560692.1 polyphosphate kinase 2 [Flaviramulus multivorans]
MSLRFHTLEEDEEYINLQTELVRLQQHIKGTNQRVLILFEGRDTAGKGGAIMRFIRFLNPRLFKVVALSKPTERELGQWYFQRYIEHLPGPGEMVLFDRSWYNRSVVEPVMGFCSKKQYNLFNKQVVQLEKLLVEDGIHLFKFWFSISAEEQKKRLEERVHNPLKQWKLSSVDVAAQSKWEDFTKYKEAMFKKTGKPNAPWIVINGNERDVARKEVIRYVVNRFDYDKKGETGERLELDKSIVSEVFDNESLKECLSK